MKQTLLILFFSILSFVFVVPKTSLVYAAPLTLSASADATIASDAPNQNYGNNSNLDVTRTIPPQDSVKTRVLLKFNINSIPSNVTIDSAIFSIYMYGCGPYSWDIDDMNIARITTNWAEMGVTWNTHKGSFDMANAINSTANCDNVGQYQNYNIKSFVNNWRSGVWPNYGIGLYGNEAPAESWTKWFAGRESGDFAHPKLVITYSYPSSSSDPYSGDESADSSISDQDVNQKDSGANGKKSKSDSDKKTATGSAIASPSAKEATPTSTTTETAGKISETRVFLLILLILILIILTGSYIIYRREGKNFFKIILETIKITK